MRLILLCIASVVVGVSEAYAVVPSRLASCATRGRVLCFAPVPAAGARDRSVGVGRGEEEEERSLAPSLALFVAIPTLALAFPFLISERLILPLLVYKRLYLYGAASAVVAIGGSRGARDPAALGTRIVALTQDLLPSRA